MGVEILYKDFAVYDKSLLQIKSGVSSTLTEKEKLKADLKNNDKPQLYASFEQRYMDCDVPYEFIDLNCLQIYDFQVIYATNQANN